LKVGLQLPEQHCESAVQTVPWPRQQTPLKQDSATLPDEQQSWSATQVPPMALQAQVPSLPHRPLQHWLPLVQDLPLSSQQRPLLATREQQPPASPLMPDALLPRFAPSSAQHADPARPQMSPAQQPPPLVHEWLALPQHLPSAPQVRSPQQAAPPVQVSPACEQQRPPVQRRSSAGQQSSSAVHAAPPAMQLPHVPPVQESPVQHWLLMRQATPRWSQQESASQPPPQQSRPSAQSKLASWQTA